MVQESSIIVEIQVLPASGTNLGLWIALGAGIASVIAVSDVILWRRLHRRKSPPDLFPITKGKLAPTLSPGEGTIDIQNLFPTRTEEEEVEDTYISTTQVEKVWVVDLISQQVLTSRLYREELFLDGREESLDLNISVYCSQNAFDLPLLQTPMFVHLSNLNDQERLLIANIGNGHLLVLLFSSRITRTFLRMVVAAGEKLTEIAKNAEKFEAGNLFEILEVHLKLSRSVPYMMSGQGNVQALKESIISDFAADADICRDAEQLTLFESTWVLQKASQLKDLIESDPILDEEEIL